MRWIDWVCHALFGWQYVAIFTPRGHVRRLRWLPEGRPYVRLSRRAIAVMNKQGDAFAGYEWTPLTFARDALVRPSLLTPERGAQIARSIPR